jgi:hypothetical protein
VTTKGTFWSREGSDPVGGLLRELLKDFEGRLGNLHKDGTMNNEKNPIVLTIEDFRFVLLDFIEDVRRD